MNDRHSIPRPLARGLVTAAVTGICLLVASGAAATNRSITETRSAPSTTVATSEPATSEPATSEPATSESATSEPATSESATSEPAADAGTSSEPITIVDQSFFLVGKSDLVVTIEVDEATAQRLVTAATIGTSPSTVTIATFPAIADPASVDIVPVGSPLGQLSVPLSANNIEVVDAADGRNRTRTRINVTIGRRNASKPVDGSIERLAMDSPGLYPMTVSLNNQGSTVGTVASHVYRTDAQLPDGGQLHAAVVARVVDIGPLPSTEQIDVARRQIAELIALADQTDITLNVLIPASVIDHVLRGDRQLARQTRQALADDVILGAPGWPINPDVAVAANLEEPFAQSWRAGDDILAKAFPQSQFDKSTTLIHEPVSAQGIDLLGATGMRQALIAPQLFRSAIEVDRRDLVMDTAQSGRILLNAPQMSTPPNVMVTTDLSEFTDAATTDAATTDILSDGTGGQGPSAPRVEDAIHTLAKVLATPIISDQQPQSVVFATPSLGIPDPSLVAAIAELGLGDLDAADAEPEPIITWDAAGAVIDRAGQIEQGGTPVQIAWQVDQSNPLVDRLPDIAAAEVVVSNTVSMLPADDERRVQWMNQVRSARSTLLSDREAGILVRRTLDANERLRGAVPPPEPFEFTLTGSNATLRIQLTNNSGTPLNVVFLMRSTRLIAPERTEVTLAPRTVTVVPVPVTSRSNGVAIASIQVATPAGDPLFEPVELTGTSNSFGGIGTVLTVGALLVLFSWWFSHIGKQRKSQRERTASPEPS